MFAPIEYTIKIEISIKVVEIAAAAINYFCNCLVLKTENLIGLQIIYILELIFFHLHKVFFF